MESRTGFDLNDWKDRMLSEEQKEMVRYFEQQDDDDKRLLAYLALEIGYGKMEGNYFDQGN